MGRPIPWRRAEGRLDPEAKRLGLDSARARQRLDWRPRHDVRRAVERSARWYAAWLEGADMARASVADCEEVLG
jgi:CDP-glucose 4,6-dehydratase